MKRNITTVFGLGYVPLAAGWASLLGLLAYLAVEHFAPVTLFVHIGIIALILIWSLVILYIQRAFSSSDPHEIVVDEFLGVYCCLFVANTDFWLTSVLLFIVFCILDYFKPWPISLLDRKTWWGVVFDDLAIGILIALLWRIILVFLS